MLSTRHLLRFLQRVFLIRFFLLVMLFSLLILADSFLLLHLAERVGKYLTLSGAAATGLVALIFLVNSVGAILSSLRTCVRMGYYPRRQYAALGGIIVASLFLLTPGFFTDALGLLIYLPPMRHLVGLVLVRRLDGRLKEAYEHLKLSEFEP